MVRRSRRDPALRFYSYIVALSKISWRNSYSDSLCYSFIDVIFEFIVPYIFYRHLGDVFSVLENLYGLLSSLYAKVVIIQRNCCESAVFYRLRILRISQEVPP